MPPKDTLILWCSKHTKIKVGLLHNRWNLCRHFLFFIGADSFYYSIRMWVVLNLHWLIPQETVILATAIRETTCTSFLGQFRHFHNIKGVRIVDLFILINVFNFLLSYISGLDSVPFFLAPGLFLMACCRLPLSGISHRFHCKVAFA